MIQPAPRPLLQLAIRPASATDLGPLQRALPPAHPEAHVRRLADQRVGHASYLIAWDGSRPVGHALVRWNGANNPELVWRLGYHQRPPYLEAVFVAPTYRSLGIGTSLLREAERQAAQRGHRRIGLAVAVENWRARALYHRLGYRESGLGRFVSSWSYVDDHGEEVAEQETCIYLRRSLTVADGAPRAAGQGVSR